MNTTKLYTKSVKQDPVTHAYPSIKGAIRFIVVYDDLKDKDVKTIVLKHNAHFCLHPFMDSSEGKFGYQVTLHPDSRAKLSDMLKYVSTGQLDGTILYSDEAIAWQEFTDAYAAAL